MDEPRRNSCKTKNLGWWFNWTSKGSFLWFPKGNILEFTNVLATVNFKISRKCNFCEATHICTMVDAFKGKDVKCEAVGKIVEMTAELM